MAVWFATVSVEDILSFEVRSKFHVSKGRGATSSGRVLQELGKTFPEAASLFNRCFEGSSLSPPGAGGSRDDYAQLQSASPAERKVLWIRVALVDAKLQAIVEQLMKKPRYVFGGRTVQPLRWARLYLLYPSFLWEFEWFSYESRLLYAVYYVLWPPAVLWVKEVS